MNNFAKTLLAGVSLCALATVPAMADAASGFHFAHLHGGRIVNKTRVPNHGATHITYTYGVYSYISSSLDLHKTVKLNETFIKSESPCEYPEMKMKAPKRSTYGTIGVATETYTGICGSGIKTVFYGNTYKLTDPDAKDKTDRFVSTIISKFEQNGTKYKGTLNLDVSVTID